MTVILCESKLQSQVMEENLLPIYLIGIFVYRPLTQGLFCKASAAFSSPWNLQSFTWCPVNFRCCQETFSSH